MLADQFGRGWRGPRCRSVGCSTLPSAHPHILPLMCSSSPLFTPSLPPPTFTHINNLFALHQAAPLISSLLLLRFLPFVLCRLSPVIFSCWDISQLTVVTATAERLRTPSKRTLLARGLIKRLFVQVYVTTSFRNVSSNLLVAMLQPPERRSVSTPALTSEKVDVDATLAQSNMDAARVTNAAQVL